MSIPEPIRKFIRRTLLRAARRFEGPEQESFDVGIDSIPDTDERAVMSAHQLAHVVADAARNQGKDSVAFILLSYEMQLKLAKEQSSATYRAAVCIRNAIATDIKGFLFWTLKSPGGSKKFPADELADRI